MLSEVVVVQLVADPPAVALACREAAVAEQPANVGVFAAVGHDRLSVAEQMLSYTVIPI